jgi:Cd2+/Zn2+-exporting ATPase
MKKSFIFRIITCLILGIGGFAVEHVAINYNNEISIALYILAYCVIGIDIVFKAIRNIFHGEIFDENFLMVVATLGALATGEYPEAIAVMFLYQIGEEFQDIAVGKSRNAIKELMQIKPEYANVLRNGETVQVKPEEVEIGETIIIKPGEKVPLDGRVKKGTSMLDTKTITGESVPKKIVEQELIYSGSINLNAVLEVKVTKKFEDSTVAKILELVEEATSKKAKTEKFITKFARYYTPTVCLFALALALVPTLVFKQELMTWVYRALIFLVISCPCALVISVPLGFFGGIGGASKKGILIKGSNYLEALSKAKYAMFDKTGTITKGVFEIQKINPVDISEEELIRVAAHGEKFSNHPIALSIKKRYKGKYDESKVENLEEISGKGIKARIFFQDTLIGNAKLLQENKVKFKPVDEAGTVIYVAIEGQYKGYILIADKVKDDSKKAIEDLKKEKIKKTYILTGDEKRIADKIAQEVGVDECKSELLPDQKLENLETILKSKGEKEKVIFVGDGVNDSPCLARADIGIAMGGIGADAAIEAADVVIMTDELTKIAQAIKIAKKTMKIVKQNIVFALTVKIIILALGALGFANMWLAVFADVGVSMIAILHSMKTLKG